MRRKTPSRLHKGFSLIEIMVVIAIVAVVTAIAVVSWSHSRAHSEKHFSQDRLISVLNAHRLLALNEHLSYKCRAKETLLVCQRWTRNTKGYIGWYDHGVDSVLSDNLHMVITHSQPKKSHAIYFLSSGEIPAFTLAVMQKNQVLYRLESNGVAIVKVKKTA